MYITMYDFALIILISLSVVVSAYLIAALRQVCFVFDRFRGILVASDNEIRETLSLLPLVLVNINLLSVSLAKTADQTNHAFQSLQTDVFDTVDDLQDGLRTFIFYAKVIGEVFKSVFSKIA